MVPALDIVDELLRTASIAKTEEPFDPALRHEPVPDFRALEADLASSFPALSEFEFPPNFRLLYSHVFPALDCGLIRWASSVKGDPLSDLHQLLCDTWDSEELAGRGFIPIAEDGNDGGPLCMDVRNNSNGPIVLWDHETQTASPVLYDDFDSLIRSATHLLRGGHVRDLDQFGGSGAAREFRWWDE